MAGDSNAQKAKKQEKVPKISSFATSIQLCKSEMRIIEKE